MTSILIATRNRDKAAIIECLLRSFSHSLLDVYTPVTIGCPHDVVETGSAIERAQAKAYGHLSCCGGNCHLILGSDDAFRIPSKFGEEILCDSEKVTKLILENGIENDSEVFLLRAYWFIKPAEGTDKDGVPLTQFGCITEIPFVMLGSRDGFKGIEYEPNTYPLSKILSRRNSNIPVIEESQSDMNEYYSSYSNEAKKIFLNLLT